MSSIRCKHSATNWESVAKGGAFEQYVRLKDVNTEPGLPEQVTLDVVRDGRKVARLNLQENKRLNENANVYESVYDKGKQRQVKKETKPLTGFKYYQDKQNAAAVSVTCEESPTGSCKRAVEGYLNIGEETFEIRPASQSTAKRMARNNRRNLHMLTRVAHFKSQERRRNTEEKYPKDYIETNSTIMPGKTGKRQSKTEYAVEILAVIDPYLWKRYLDKTEASNGMTEEQATEYRLRKKLAHVINGVSLRYESIEDPAFDVYVTISGFKFYKTDDERSPVPKEGEDALKLKKGEPYVGAAAYLNNLPLWLFNLSDLPHDDHIMVFTGCELYKDGNISNTDVAGIAQIGGACNWGRAEVQEEGSYFVTTAIAAHELGHNLNAYHDGKKTSAACKADDRYIMAPSVTRLLAEEEYTVNPWRFSTCSIAAFRSYFQSEDGKCLTDHGDYYDKNEWDKHNEKLPGELYSLDEQCKLINGDYSGTCFDYRLPATDERICRELNCIAKNGCTRHTPARGSPCGNPAEKKWCIDGKCVAREIEGTIAPPVTTKGEPITKLPEKPDEECFETTAIEYKGHRKVTKSGKECSPWKYTEYQDASKFPDGSVAEASNYCRSPDNDALTWCIYANEGWEHCDVQKCKPSDNDCFQTTSDMYIGTKSVSLSGLTCIRWESTDLTDIATFPDTSIADAANYCRDPDGTGAPWCYVESISTYWEVCDIPKCE